MLNWLKWRLYWRWCRRKHDLECRHTIHRSYDCTCYYGGLDCKCGQARVSFFADPSAD